MKIAYSGKTEFLTEPQKKKIDTRLSKFAKFLDMKKGEREAHVTLKVEKRAHRADLSVLYKGDVLVTSGDGADMATAVGAAIEKLDRQLTRSREKKHDSRTRVAARDDKRGKATISTDRLTPSFQEMEKEVVRQVPNTSGAVVHRVNGASRRKPLTVDEAVLAIKKNQRFLVFRDSDTNGTSILVRRDNGEFDLIETNP
ncbi:MAG: ribosome-associated translation inhibitor RaiA [Bryobacterales bacterium]|nr:ribosome-associated translation inhibitor RaiA [Bryobacterales bacterium]